MVILSVTHPRHKTEPKSGSRFAGVSLFYRIIGLISLTLLICHAWRMRRYAVLAHTITPSATLVRTAVGGLSGVVVVVLAIHRWTF